MKGLILDYNHSEAFILLEDDSVSTVPINSLPTLLPIGSTINLSTLNNCNNLNHHSIRQQPTSFS